MFIANILRNCAAKNEIIARYAETMFVIIQESDSEQKLSLSEQKLQVIEDTMLKRVKSNGYISPPELIAECRTVFANKITNTVEKLTAILYKI